MTKNFTSKIKANNVRWAGTEKQLQSPGRYLRKLKREGTTRMERSLGTMGDFATKQVQYRA